MKRFTLSRWFRNISIANKLYLVVGMMALLIAMELLVLIFSINTLSSVRASVGAEGLWSKAQKDAIYSLRKYTHNGKEEYYQDFLHLLKVPFGDRKGRIEMVKENPNYEIIRKGFLEGGVHPDDIDGMIKLFRRFHSISYINKALTVWTEGDSLMAEFCKVADDLHSEIMVSGVLVHATLDENLGQIDEFNTKFTILENSFSTTLSEGSRWLEGLVLKILLSIALTVEILGLSLTIIISRNISKSVGEILMASEQIAKGNYTAKAIIYSQDEIGRLAGSFNNMTNELVSHLQHLKESEDQIKTIFKRAPDAVITINEEGIIMHWNPQAEIIFGWKEKEVLGKTLSETIIPERYREQHTKGMKHFFKTGEGPIINKLVEISALKKDKNEFPVELKISASKINDHHHVFIGFIRDISVRKKSEELLKDSNERFLKIFDSNPIGMAIIDLETNIYQYVNEKCLTSFAAKKEDFIGKKINEVNLIDAESADKVLTLLKQQGYVRDIEILVRKKNGETFWSISSIQTIIINDKKFLLSSFSDITERKKTEADLKQKSEELVLANKELVFQNKEKEKRAKELISTNKELESFNYVSSHDLQEPLRKIRNFVKVMLDEETENLSKDGKYYLHRTFETVERMQMLIEDLLTYSRTNNIEPKFEKTDLNIILDEVIEDFKEVIQEKKAIIQAGNLCETSTNVIRFQFRQLIHNLISNSLKFSKHGSPPHIIIKSESVQGSKLNDKRLLQKIDYCHITYTDNGIGFDPQYNERIFEIFQRLHSQEEYEGTGIGLAICRKIIENHKGIITATGKLNKGAQFDIYIPSN